MRIQSKKITETFSFQVLVVITDGKQTTSKAYTKLSVASQGVKNKDVAVYAVGVGKGADASELREIASSQENVFVSASFKELQNLAAEIRKRLCEGQCRNHCFLGSFLPFFLESSFHGSI